MTFRTFNRTLYYALESTEGTFSAPNTATGYIEVMDPTYSVTNRSFERNPTRNSITPAYMFVPGTRKDVPSATCEISFTVEMAGSGTAATRPRWGTLLKACGLEAADGLQDDDSSSDSDRALYAAGIGNLTKGASAPDPVVMFHKENLSMQAGTSYSSGDRVGRLIGDTHYDDENAYFVKAGATGTWASSDNVVGEVSTNYAAVASNFAASGCAWFPTSGTKLGGGNNSSLSMVLAIDDAGTCLQMKGARGNVEIVMTASDRVLLNFTFTGVLHKYVEATGYGTAMTAEARPIPPAFVGVTMEMKSVEYGTAGGAGVADQIFQNMTINLGNQITVREDAVTTSGYSAAHITARQPTMTFNPDAVAVSTFDYWEAFLAGDNSRMRLSWGATSGNKFEIRMPSLQFAGVADGNRDEVVIFDSTTNLNGGDLGSSVTEDFDSTDTSGDTNMNDRMGKDNEFFLYQL